MYTALYRKWRPSTFDDVIGQKHITETLKRQVMTGRYSHAYLFTGTRGTGKTTCARILAKSLNCENPVNGNPCNCCPTCLGIDRGSILDVEELDAASNNGVDNVRTLRDEAVFTPVAAKKRVYIIDEVHMLSTPAFNALLKILEEPPEHLIFILATTELHKVPATILSRCQRYAFKRIQPAELADYLKEIARREEIQLTDEAALILARLADGSVRDSLSLLDQCSGEGVIDAERVLSAIGLAGKLETENLAEKIFNNSPAEALELFENLYNNGKDVTAVLNELCCLERDVLLTKIAPGGADALLTGSYEAKKLKEFSSMRSERLLMSDIETLQETLAEIVRSTDRKISAQLCLLRLCAATEAPPIKLAGPAVQNAVQRPAAQVQRPAAASAHPASPVSEERRTVQNDSSDTAPRAPAAAASEINPVEKAAPAPKPVIEQPPREEEHSAQSAQPEKASGGMEELMEMLKTELEGPIYDLLSDTSHVETSISGNTLALYTKSPFERFMLDNGVVPEKIKNAAEKVFGRAMIVKIEEQKDEGSVKPDKLDKLKKFDNIKFQ